MKTQQFIKIFFFLSASFFISFEALSEYRVYQYRVTNKMRPEGLGNSQIVTSAMDPVAYLAYHGGNLSTRLDLLRSWHCLGHTGNHKKFCSPPLEKLLLGENL